MGRHSANARRGDIAVDHGHDLVDGWLHEMKNPHVVKGPACDTHTTMHNVTILPAPSKLPRDLFPKQRWWIAQAFFTVAVLMSAGFCGYGVMVFGLAGWLPIGTNAAIVLLGLGLLWAVKIEKRRDR